VALLHVVPVVSSPVDVSGIPRYGCVDETLKPLDCILGAAYRLVMIREFGIVVRWRAELFLFGVCDRPLEEHGTAKWQVRGASFF
jgi:hypothetical protein